MGDKSGIEWTDASWNFVVGCTPVSAGCDHCYAQTMHNRRHQAFAAGTYPDAPPQYHEPFETVQLLPERLALPLRWTKPRKIFVNSIADLFHKDVPDSLIDKAFGIMALSTRHTYQILTKRPQRMMRYLSDPGVADRVQAQRDRWIFGLVPSWRGAQRAELAEIRRRQIHGEPTFEWPLPNVWIGVSVENQEAAYRIDYLIQTPAAVRFLSCEPLLGPLNIQPWLMWESSSTGGPWYDNLKRERIPQKSTLVGWMFTYEAATDIHWVIAGGESGPGHRPIDPDWVRFLRDQCVNVGVPFLFKQWGGLTSKAGGRELDRRTWDQYPELGSAT